MASIDYILYSIVAIWIFSFIITIRLHWKRVDAYHAKLERNREARRDTVMLRLITENK